LIAVMLPAVCTDVCRLRAEQAISLESTSVVWTVCGTGFIVIYRRLQPGPVETANVAYSAFRADLCTGPTQLGTHPAVDR
jgi:hypothetical protein